MSQPTQVLRLTCPDPALADGVVSLRPWTHDDLACVEEASRDPRIPEGTTVPTVFTQQEGRLWIERQWGRYDKGQGISLAIADARSDEALGCVVLTFRSQPGTVELGYWILERARGQGLASRAVSLLASWALTDVGLARVEAFTEPDNEASLRTLERSGFRREGHLRSYLGFKSRRADAFMYSLVTSDLDSMKERSGQPASSTDSSGHHEHEELITPEQTVSHWFGEERVALKAAVITWGQRSFDAVEARLKAERWNSWYEGRNFLSINTEGIGVLRAPVGAPGTIMMMEEIRALGATSFVGFGLAGGISSALRPGHIVLATRCAAEEGTSAHYGGSDDLSPSKTLLSNLGAALSDNGIGFTEGGVWTTDAPYRETVEKIRAHQDDGILAVDMETSGMYAFGRFRKVNVCNILMIADLLGDEWDPSALLSKDDIQELLEAAAAAVVSVVKQA